MSECINPACVLKIRRLREALTRIVEIEKKEWGAEDDVSNESYGIAKQALDEK